MDVMVRHGIFVLLIVTVCVNASSTDNDIEWNKFKNDYNKTYDNSVEEERKSIFIENLELIKKHNANNGELKLKMNQFGDLSHDEYRKLKTELICMSEIQVHLGSNEMKDDSFPKQVDLRTDKRCVTKVKDQGEGPAAKSSLAFSTIGALEGQIFKKDSLCPNSVMKSPSIEILDQSLSEESIIRCMENKTINSYESRDAIDFVNKTGVFTDKSYSCAKKLNFTCPNPDEIYPSVSFCDIALDYPKSTDRIKSGLNKFREPVMAFVDASHQSFQFYHNGIYNESGCQHPPKFNHAVLIMGYGEDYWLVKNSWGTSWGDQGYMKIAYNNCGIDKAVIKLSTEKCCSKCK